MQPCSKKSQLNENEKNSLHLNTKKENPKIFGPQKQKHEHPREQQKVMIVGSGDQRRIPSVVIVDRPQFSEKSPVTTNNDNQQSESTSLVEHRDPTKGKVSPGSGRLLPYVPKRYVIPRVPAGMSSPSASSSSATTAKRIVKEVSFEDDDLDEGTDINAPNPRLDTFDETDEFINDESGIENNQDTTNGDVSDVSGVIGDQCEGISIPLPAILRDYQGPAPSTAADVLRKRGGVISPPPADDIARQLAADLDMGPLNKEFDPLRSSINDTTGQRNSLTTDGISNTVTNVDLLSAQANKIDNWETQFSDMLNATEKPYQTNRDRRTTSDISTTLDTYGTYRRGPVERTTNSYKPNYIDGSAPYQHHQQTTLEDKKLENTSSITNQYNQSFYEDDFLTESEKQRLSYLRLIGTSSRGCNGSSSFNRRTSDSLIDTSYHHSNVSSFDGLRGILTPSFEGAPIINGDQDSLNIAKDILRPSALTAGGLPSTELSSEYNGNMEVQHLILDPNQTHLDDRNQFNILGNDTVSSNAPLNPFDDVSCKYFGTKLSVLSHI